MLVITVLYPSLPQLQVIVLAPTGQISKSPRRIKLAIHRGWNLLVDPADIYGGEALLSVQAVL